MSDKERIPAEVFIFFKLEGLKTALSDSPFVFNKSENSLFCVFWNVSHPFYTVQNDLTRL